MSRKFKYVQSLSFDFTYKKFDDEEEKKDTDEEESLSTGKLETDKKAKKKWLDKILDKKEKKAKR